MPILILKFITDSYRFPDTFKGPIVRLILIVSLKIIKLFLLYSGLNRCPSKLLGLSKSHEGNKGRIRQEYNSMQHAKLFYRPTS